VHDAQNWAPALTLRCAFMTANEVLVAPSEGRNAIVTHGILLRPDTRLRASSSGLGWRGIAASVQSESPFSGSYDAVRDHLLVIHVGRPARVAGRTAGKVVDKMIAPGHFFLWPGGQSLSVELRDPLETVHIYVKRDLVDAIAREFGFGEVELEPRLGEIDTLIEALALEVRGIVCDPASNAALYVASLAHALGARLEHAYSNRTSGRRAPKETLPSLNRIQLDRVDDYIEANLDSRIELENLAAAGGLSAAWFARRFRDVTGLPPHQYVLRRRIERAKHLLTRTDAPIAQIAFDCGFAHQEHLTRVFKRVTGLTPGAFRRTIRN
jgi:AraC family transcriptional regulator